MKHLSLTLIAALALVCAGCKENKPHHHHHPQQVKVIHKAPPPKGVHKAPAKPLPPKGKPLTPPHH